MSVYNDGFSFAESSDSFIIDIDRTSDEYKIWQGLVGAHYTPYVDAEGNLSWTNNGDLPNPPTQNIRGEPGTGLTIKGIVATVGDLPQSASNGDAYLVGTDAPYEGYLYTNNQWVDIGEIGVGQPGRGIVSIAKTSSTGTNPVIDTYTITYTDSTTSTFLVTNGVKGDTGTAAGFGTPTATIDANTGTPSVTVTASGSSTAKVFAFAFHNLKGAKGDPGDAGQGVPASGTTGQLLAKKTNADYDTEWVNPPEGTVTDVTVNGTSVVTSGVAQVTVPTASSTTPADLGTASAGSSANFARGDHVHNYPTIVHVGDSAPSDSNIEVWLDTDEQGASAVTSVNGQSGAITLKTVKYKDYNFTNLAQYVGTGSYYLAVTNAWSQAGISSNAEILAVTILGWSGLGATVNVGINGTNNMWVFFASGFTITSASHVNVRIVYQE